MAWAKQLNSNSTPCITAKSISINNFNIHNVVGLLFRFCLIDNNDIIYKCKDTLHISSKCPLLRGDARSFMLNDNNELYKITIYTSII